MRSSSLIALFFIGISTSKVHHAYAAPSSGQLAQINALPSSCVTLHEGRACFAKVTLSWTVNRPLSSNRLCLVQKQPKRQLKCWQKSHGDTINIEFESNSPLIYQLLNENSQVLAETKVDVSWVYEATPRKRRWRIF